MTVSKDFLKFLLVGGMAAAVNVGARAIFQLAVSFELAIVLAFFCGMATAFELNRRFVFSNSANDAIHRQGMRFAMVNAAALAQVWIVGVWLAHVAFPWAGMVWHPETVAHMIAVASPVATSYFAHKHYSFG